MNKHMIEVYVLRNALKQTITYTQGTDALPTVFVFKDYVIPEDTVATVYIAKPSGKGLHGLAEVNVGDNTVTVVGDKQMTAEPGTSYIQLELVNEEKTLFTFNQPIMVIKSESPIQSENGMPFIDELIGKLNNATEGVEGAVESANTAAASANEAAEKANAAASGDLSEKTTTYTESTAESPPASGGKLPAIIGWCIGKIKALVTDVSSLNSNKANAGYADFSSLTLEEIYTFIGNNNLFFAGRTKLPDSFSPTGTQNWFRCIWECQNKGSGLSNCGLNVIAMQNSNIWHGMVGEDADGNYVLKWFKLVRQGDIVDNLLSTNQYAPLSANQGNILDGKITNLSNKFIDTGYKTSPYSVKLTTGKSMLLTLSDGSTYIIIYLSSGIVITPVAKPDGSYFTVAASGDNITVTNKEGNNVRLMCIYY